MQKRRLLFVLLLIVILSPCFTAHAQEPVPPSFKVVVNPDTATIAPGGQITAAVRVAWHDQAIAIQASLKASAIPPGINVTFSPSLGPMPLTSTMQVLVNQSVPEGSYRISVDATVGGRIQSEFYVLKVTAPPPQQEQPVQQPLQEEASSIELTYQAFYPATFRMRYRYTNDIRVQVKPLALSNFVYEAGPTNVTIQMPSSDNYVITIEIKYPQTVTQTISWALTGGDPPLLPSGADGFPISSDTIKMTIRVSTTVQPRPPTSNELAQATLGLLQNTFNSFEVRYSTLIKENSQNFSTLYTFSAITFAGLIGLLYWVTKILGSRPVVHNKM